MIANLLLAVILMTQSVFDSRSVIRCDCEFRDSRHVLSLILDMLFVLGTFYEHSIFFNILPLICKRENVMLKKKLWILSIGNLLH